MHDTIYVGDTQKPRLKKKYYGYEDNGRCFRADVDCGTFQGKKGKYVLYLKGEHIRTAREAEDLLPKGKEKSNAEWAVFRIPRDKETIEQALNDALGSL